MLNQKPNSDPILPTERTYDLRDKNTSLYTNSCARIHKSF